MSLRNLLIALLVACAAITPPATLSAQVALDRGTVGTALELRKLDGVKRVLMIAAHPDDEDTALLTALSRGMGAETAYLSLTRGDGGQNLIGPELGEGLGVVRTGELLAARSLDGGAQYFSRAFDYGFSKSADEAFSKWPREELLRDAVFVIRSFRPHVVVSVFSGTPRDGHGQHQAAGIIAREAFQAAGDPERFPELAAYGVEPWQPAKLYRRPRGLDATHTVETGAYDPVLGRSHFQLAMESRSQHRSQDMGVPQPAGPRLTGLILWDSGPGVEDGPGFFAGIDTTLAAGVEALPAAIRDDVREGVSRWQAGLNAARASLSALNPAAVVPPLTQGLTALRRAAAVATEADAGAEVARVLRARGTQASEFVLDAAGVSFRVISADDLLVPGESVEVELELWNGGPYRITEALPELDLPEGWEAEPLETDKQDDFSSFFGRGATGSQLDAQGGLAPGALARWRYRVSIPADADPSRLYFRASPRDGEMYRWPEDPSVWGLPKGPPVLRGQVGLRLEADGDSGDGAPMLVARAPARFVGVDKALGEFTKPVLVVPAVSVALETGSMVWPQGSEETREIRVTVRGEAQAGVSGELRLEVPAGWFTSPPQGFRLDGPGTEAGVTFRVRPEGVGVGRHTFRAVADTNDGGTFTETVTLIDYPHIERTAMLDPAVLNVSVVPVQVADVTVGYLMGSGDDGLVALRQMGVDVREVSPAEIAGGVPADLDVLVLGIRVYETQPQAAAANDQILDFARRGGTVLVQYNKYEFPAGGYAPYPVEMGRPAPRVTDENSPVRILDEDSPVMTSPNRITEADFDGWIQERGLYFIRDWDRRYETVLEFTDPGEDPARGSLLVAPVGEGAYIYTGISFFRQFPAGVPGAYRLFANLVSLRGDDLR